MYSIISYNVNDSFVEFQNSWIKTSYSKISFSENSKYFIFFFANNKSEHEAFNAKLFVYMEVLQVQKNFSSGFRM